MPAERVSMRQIREVLRLRFASEPPQRAIASGNRSSEFIEALEPKPDAL
jgi:hypothetical protein